MSAALLTKRQAILPGSLQLSPKRRCKIRHFCLQISGICTCKKQIREELDVDIRVGRLLETVEYDYPEFHLTMHCFICELLSEEIVLKEHEDARWLKEEELDTVDWLPADVGGIGKIFALK